MSVEDYLSRAGGGGFSDESDQPRFPSDYFDPEVEVPRVERTAPKRSSDSDRCGKCDGCKRHAARQAAEKKQP